MKRTKTNLNLVISIKCNQANYLTLTNTLMSMYQTENNYNNHIITNDFLIIFYLFS